MTVLSKSFLSGLCFGSIATAATILAYYARTRTPIQDADLNNTVYPTEPHNSEEELFTAEQLVRTTQFFGQGGVQKLQASHVVIVGLGGVELETSRIVWLGDPGLCGVIQRPSDERKATSGFTGNSSLHVICGSHCAVSLARSGVGRLTLIDFDQVTLSSLNRHASATREEVGVPKVEALKEYLRKIFPQLRVDTRYTLWQASDAASLLLGPNGELPSFVVDCIDNVPTKAALIHAGAAGGKSDPTRIRIDDISLTREDELCRAIRTRLRKEYQIHEGPLFCYSTEREEKLGLLPLHDFQLESPDEFRPIEQFRVRIVPVIAPLPAIFGQAMASYVLCELAERPIQSLKTSTKEADAEQRLNKKNYRQLFEAVKQFYTRAGTVNTVKGTVLELSYGATQNLFLRKFKGTCVLTQKELGPRALQLVPWRPMNENNRASLVKSFQEGNLVCMEQKAAQSHLKQIFAHAEDDSVQKALTDVYESVVIERIDSLLQSDF